MRGFAFLAYSEDLQKLLTSVYSCVCLVQISAEEAQKVLKDLVFDMWTADECEERTDTLKMLALIDFFLPFLPLERLHIQQLFNIRLQDRQRVLVAEKTIANLTWTPEVVQFLLDRVWPSCCHFCHTARAASP